VHWAPQTYELNGAAQCDAQLKHLKKNRDMAVVVIHTRNLLDRKPEQETILQVEALDCACVQYSAAHCYVDSEWVLLNCHHTGKSL
jgi:hypothetical protein